MFYPFLTEMLLQKSDRQLSRLGKGKNRRIDPVGSVTAVQAIYFSLKTEEIQIGVGFLA